MTKALGAELCASAERQAAQVDYLDCNKEMLCVGFCYKVQKALRGMDIIIELNSCECLCVYCAH